MKRRDFIKTSALTTVGAISVPNILTASQKAKYSWKIALTWPQNMGIFVDSAVNFAKNVEVMSGGTITIRVDAAEKHKAPLNIFDLVRGGQYEMGHSASYYWKGKESSTVFFTSVPFGMTAQEQNAWFYFGGGMELMDEVYAKHGLYSFNGGNTTNQMGGWFKKEIKSIEDLKGLKMRIPGFAGEVLARVGASPVNIAPGELYTALERGTIDALEWVGPALDIKMGFQKIAPYYYTGWHEPASEMQFLINRKKFDSLPNELKEILKSAMLNSSFMMLNQSQHENAVVWDSMKKEYPNIEIKTFPKEVIEAIKKATLEAYEEESSKNPMFKKVYNSQKEYISKAREWTKISDLAYLNSLE
ncbi:MAG: TRAP transporter substrate-binding protein [Arcobacteraceae bacterium]|jgi:TRAP-type mannitol/chloroaromatic compound transport system substrate-binding protein|nr:TRAP transporter substrate-binding protein [Arcobacteraceae bacterium]MDY0364996.1 TRAP transporter substrate-binding protein [Arcobacteraceae bacterium]